MALLRRLRAWLHRGNPAHCVGCGHELTPEERHYYEHTCERCEQRAMAVWINQ